MKNQLLAAAIAFTASQASYAYMAEVELNQAASTIKYEGVDVSFTEEIDNSATLLKASVFFGQVDTAKGPLAEAAFLDKAGWLGVSYTSGNQKTEFTTLGITTHSEADNDVLGLQLHAVAGPLIIEAGYQEQTTEFKNVGGERDLTALRFGLGGYMTDYSTIIVSLLSNSLENQAGFVLYEDTGINAALKFFIPFNNGQALSVGGDASILAGEANNGAADNATFAINVFASYYLTNKLALTLALDASANAQTNDNTGIDSAEAREALSFSAEYFILDQLAISGGVVLGIGVSEKDNGMTTDETDLAGAGFNIGLKGRF